MILHARMRMCNLDPLYFYCQHIQAPASVLDEYEQDVRHFCCVKAVIPANCTIVVVVIILCTELRLLNQHACPDTTMRTQYKPGIARHCRQLRKRAASSNTSSRLSLISESSALNYHLYIKMRGTLNRGLR